LNDHDTESQLDGRSVSRGQVPVLEELRSAGAARVTKSASYRETFRRHRLLLSLPMVLGMLIAGFLAVTGGKSYMSTASLWVDTPAATDSSLGNLNPALTPPSQQEQSVITELLATRQFVLDVGHHSLLGPYLASHSSKGFSVTSLFGAGAGSLDSQIIAALSGGQLTTTMPGPQVLQVSYTGPTPAVARSTLATLVNELPHESSQLSQQHNQAALAYDKAQVQAAAQALQAARNQAVAYHQQHPKAAPTDPNLTALATAEAAAGTQLAQANAALNAVASSAKGGGATTVQVIDAASNPPGPTTGKKKELEGILGGLAAGALISLLGTIALTRGKTDPWEDELAQEQAATTIGVVPAPAATEATNQHEREPVLANGTGPDES